MKTGSLDPLSQLIGLRTITADDCSSAVNSSWALNKPSVSEVATDQPPEVWTMLIRFDRREHLAEKMISGEVF